MLACIDAPDTAGADRLRTTKTTVAKWRGQFVQRRLEGLYDEPRVGAPRTILDAQVEALLVKTLETTPPGETARSTRSMAKAAGISHTMVGRICAHIFTLAYAEGRRRKPDTKPRTARV